jgi:hypothetical protein
MHELKKIESQIEHLRSDMAFFFSKAIDAEKYDTCFSQLAPFETKIRNAWSNLHAMHAHKHASDYDTYKNLFLGSCIGSQCVDATLGIMATIDQESSYLHCDMMELLYKGNPNGDYFQGVRGQVTAKGGYLTTLVAMGITV